MSESHTKFCTHPLLLCVSVQSWHYKNSVNPFGWWCRIWQPTRTPPRRHFSSLVSYPSSQKLNIHKYPFLIKLHAWRCVSVWYPLHTSSCVSDVSTSLTGSRHWSLAWQQDDNKSFDFESHHWISSSLLFSTTCKKARGKLFLAEHHSKHNPWTRTNKTIAL